MGQFELGSFCKRALAGLGIATLLLAGVAANATVVYSADLSLASSDPTQLGRLSRNGIAQDWGYSEAYPGVINAATTYHYRAFDTNLTSALNGTVGYGGYIQISFDSLSPTTFLSAYMDSYDPTNLATNWIGDAGTSGDYFGTDPLFFQVFVPTGHDLILVLNESATNGGLNQIGTVLVEAFADNEYTDLPEPQSLALVALSLALLPAARRLAGRRANKRVDA